MTDADGGRKLWRTLEPYHSMIYFTPEARSAYAEIGIKGRMGYFASRGAALGPVPAEVVIATFYNFHPDLVRSVIPAAWAIAPPERILEARLTAVDRALRSILGDDVVSSDEMVEAADLARRPAEVAMTRPEGRTLFAAHAALPWPDEPHLALWHAVTLLREFRGDGHLAALVANGFDACAALVTHEASGDTIFPKGLLQKLRAWSDEEWAATVERLRDEGQLDADGALTDLGLRVRQRVEDLTDAAASEPWPVLTDEEATRLRDLVRPRSKAIVASGVFLEGMEFG